MPAALRSFDGATPTRVTGQVSWMSRCLSLCCCSLFVLGTACRKETGLPEGRLPPNSKAPALYAAPRESYSTNFAPRTVPRTGSNAWSSARFSILETELSPATMVHSTGSYLGLFAGLNRQGLGAPSFIAWSTASGPRTFKRGESLDVTHVEENWLLVWFAGSQGWVNWDSPWAVFLQHKPTSMRLEESGLHLTFSEQAGDVVVMPLYGYYKPPAQGADYLEQHGLSGKKIKTWEWPAALTRDPLMRLRYWAGVTRNMPIYCEDSFSVDRTRDAVTIRSRFQFHRIQDDWGTKPLKLAPLSPSLALALVEPGFPVTLSGKRFDLEIPTPFGPLAGVQDVDAFDATFSVLQYIHETESLPTLASNVPPAARQALEQLRAAGRNLFLGPQASNAFLAPDVRCQTVEAWNSIARALPFFEDNVRPPAITWLKSRLEGSWLEQTNRTCVPGSLEALWAYAHHAGDWQLVANHWPAIRERTQPMLSARWAAYANSTNWVAAENATAIAAFARMAYRTGDLDSYYYACSAFARQLTHLWARQHGARYFRLQQPWHSMEFIDEDVFLTRQQQTLTGWEMDGPKYPAETAVRLFAQCWKGFSDPDLGRFYQDYLQPALQREFSWVEPRWSSLPSSGDLPAMEQLRSWLLNQPFSLPATNRWASNTVEAQIEAIASSYQIMRNAQPLAFQRLIPGGPATPFILGMERDIPGPHPQLITAVEIHRADTASTTSPEGWPELVWPEWKTARGEPWSFGHPRSVKTGPAPRTVREIPLNWNSRVVVLESP